MRKQLGHSNPVFVGDSRTSNQKIESINFAEKAEKIKISKTQEYDPYEHRKITHPTTNIETLFHFLKCSLGTGVLAMPNAFKNAGYVAGAIGAVIIGIICTYCIHLLVNAEYELCRRRKVPSLSYTGVAETAMGEGPAFFRKLQPYIGTTVNIFVLVCQLGGCCVYVVFVATNIKSIADYYMDPQLDLRYFMLIILMPLIFLGWVRNLKYLAPFSIAANAVTMISFGIICYYIFRSPVTLDNKIPVGTPSGFSLFFSTTLFALEAVGAVLPIKNEMKSPKKFSGSCGVLNIGMMIVVFLFANLGFFGYLNYGNEVKGSITLNLPAQDVLAQCAKGMLAFSIYITHGVVGYIAIDIIWNEYVVKKLGPQRNKLIWEYFVRTVAIVSTFLVAIAIPNFELFISFFGALALSALGLIFPAMIQIATYWYLAKGIQKVWLLISNCLLILVGLFCLVIGTYVTLVEIVATFLK